MIIRRIINFKNQCKNPLNKKAVIFLVLSIGLLFWQWERTRLVSLKIVGSSGSEYILTLPAIDKKRLDCFFRNLLIYDNGAYTLLGSKPMSFGGYLKPFTLSNSSFFWYSILPDNMKTYLGWKTWLKYQHLFTHPNFLIWSEKSPWIEDMDIIVMVNKQEIARILNCHEKDFQQVLQKKNISSETLLAELPTKALFKEVLKGHEGLIGTFLGFGRNNAWLYWKRSLGENIILSGAWPKEMEKMQMDHAGTWKFLLQTWQIPEDLFYPTFVADLNSEETIQLKNEYRKNREKIIETYHQKDFLETTLQLLRDDGHQFSGREKKL